MGFFYAYRTEPVVKCKRKFYEMHVILNATWLSFI